MTTDTLLAVAHHLAAFSLLAILAIEWALLRPGITPAQLRFVGKLDAGYGLSALTVIGVGIARVMLGPKGHAFYTGNPVFWTKMGVFVAIGLLSIAPTIALQKSRRAAPDDAQVAGLRKWLGLQLLLFPLLPIAAALMARGVGH
jgi:putative membrane protein